MLSAPHTNSWKSPAVQYCMPKLCAELGIHKHTEPVSERPHLPPHRGNNEYT
jgi:hypothetical protein